MTDTPFLPALDATRRAWLELALDACDATDALARAAFGDAPAASQKQDGTLVTATDRAIEARLRERIRAAYPDHGLVGEEYGAEAADHLIRWYLDPIDGTNNFVRGIPIFGTLIAVERDGEREVAVVSAPALRRRWVAVRGEGAWGAGQGDPWRRLSASTISSIEEAQILTSGTRDVRRSGEAPGFDALLARAWRERGFGDFWGHVLVAEGAAEAMFEMGLAPWDIAAPMLVVEEAGGACTDLDGVRGVDRPSYLSSNGTLHATLLRALRADDA